ncbi:hypothetical protein [Streptomyces prunicolor]
MSPSSRPGSPTTALEAELAEFREQLGFAQQWLESYAKQESRAGNLVDLAADAEERLKSLTLEERKEVVALFDVRVVLGDAAVLGKPGVRCAVSEWHWKTGTKVPPNPDDEQWEKVLEVLRPFFTKRHFTTKYDIRLQFEGKGRMAGVWTVTPLEWTPTSARPCHRSR